MTRDISPLTRSLLWFQGFTRLGNRKFLRDRTLFDSVRPKLHPRSKLAWSTLLEMSTNAFGLVLHRCYVRILATADRSPYLFGVGCQRSQTAIFQFDSRGRTAHFGLLTRRQSRANLSLAPLFSTESLQKVKRSSHHLERFEIYFTRC